MALIRSLRQLDTNKLENEIWPVVAPVLDGGDPQPIRELLSSTHLPAARSLGHAGSRDLTLLANMTVLATCCVGYLELGNESRYEVLDLGMKALHLKGLRGILRGLSEGHRNLDPRLICPAGILGYLRNQELDDLYDEVVAGLERAEAPSWRARTQFKLLVPADSLHQAGDPKNPFGLLREVLSGVARFTEEAARADRGCALVAS